MYVRVQELCIYIYIYCIYGIYIYAKPGKFQIHHKTLHNIKINLVVPLFESIVCFKEDVLYPKLNHRSQEAPLSSLLNMPGSPGDALNVSFGSLTGGFPEILLYIVLVLY